MAWSAVSLMKVPSLTRSLSTTARSRAASWQLGYLISAFLQCFMIPSRTGKRFRTDDSVSNIRRLKAKTKTSCMLWRDLLYADDCALIANSEEHAKSIVDDFIRAAVRYGLIVSIKKMEVLHQPRPGTPPSNPIITISNKALKRVVDKFCYLGGTISQNAKLMMRSLHGLARLVRLLNVYSIVCGWSVVCD